MKVLDKPKIDRPREKLARYGTARLSDLELLMAIIAAVMLGPMSARLRARC